MADRMKPHVAERVNIIRQWESDMGLLEAKDIGFKKYHNYYAPEGIVKDSNTVLSFGVGGEEFANKVTKQGLLDNPWLEEEDDFFSEDLLNPSIDDWIQEPKMPWETERSPYGPFMQYQK